MKKSQIEYFNEFNFFYNEDKAKEDACQEREEETMREERFSVRQLAAIGLLSALVFVFSWVQIPIGEVARIHLGNVFCALSGLLFGPLVGGLASGFGSMLFDFTNPAYIAESWITFLTKFFIGFLAGWIACRGESRTFRRDLAGAILGSAAYLVLYLLKSFVIMYLVEGQVWQAVYVQLLTKGVTSAINGVLAVVASVALVRVIRPSLERAGVLGLGARAHHS